MRTLWDGILNIGLNPITSQDVWQLSCMFGHQMWWENALQEFWAWKSLGPHLDQPQHVPVDAGRAQSVVYGARVELGVYDIWFHAQPVSGNWEGSCRIYVQVPYLARCLLPSTNDWHEFHFGCHARRDGSRMSAMWAPWPSFETNQVFDSFVIFIVLKPNWLDLLMPRGLQLFAFFLHASP